jgi:glucuronoarabinoxylan endo-1,4-beta-xylanase
MKITKFLSLLWIACFFISCGEDEIRRPDGNGDTGVLFIVDPNTTHQTIAGFGGANGVFRRESFLTAAEAQKAFGIDGADELGLSIFRFKLPYNPDDWNDLIAPAQEALAHECIILASPWSPPPALKNNNDPVRGELLAENYPAYVDHINDFVDFMETNGVDLYAISIQNEPDWEASYESCDWTAAQMRDFLAEYGDQIDERVKVAAPESLNFDQAFTNTLLNDEQAAANFDIAAGHLYGGGMGSFPTAEEQGKDIWMTEYLLNLDVGDWEGASEEEKWDETLTMLTSIHQAMENNWNAYIWWYLKRYYSFIGDGVEGTTEGEILKRGHAFAHYSRYVRPGFERIAVVEDKATNVAVTAYKGDGRIVMVLINTSNSPVANIEISIDQSNISSARTYTTTESFNRSQEDLSANEGKITISVSSKSVTTVLLQEG